MKGKVEIRHGSWFEPLGNDGGELDWLVSNPPDIPSENIEGLQEEVRRPQTGFHWMRVGIG